MNYMFLIVLAIAVDAIVIDGGPTIPVRKFYHCDLVELNHRYDDQGRRCYSQVIVWQWNPTCRRHDVEAWWLVDPDVIDELPVMVNGRWVVDRNEFRVLSAVFMQTWTTIDPETNNKLLKPENLRRGLR